MENNINEDKNNIKKFTQNALKSDISGEEVAMVMSIKSKNKVSEEKDEFQKQEEPIIH